jgi:beta-phosphoglucomutase-like phosphatase (HAD superfamily)
MVVASSMSRHGLVIFDCDGVLVDSERISNQVFVDLLGELGRTHISCSIA